MIKSKLYLVVTRSNFIFAPMKKWSLILLQQAIYIQVVLFLLAVGVFQCAQNTKDKSSVNIVSDSIQVNDGSIVSVPLSEETKSKLAQLQDSTRISGDLGDQLIGFISTNVMDFSDQFKFIGLKWDGRTDKVVQNRRSEIDDLAKIMLLFPKMNVRIESYVDNDGNPKKDEELTLARVNFIKNELVTAGVDPSRIEVKGFGQKYPVGDNKTELGRMINNRVELYITRF
ncbi:MAG: OmpA family protein [Saprospiraceae bacterium]|nr:OmpA family protein [Saprospiraceae bacterium]